MAAAAFGGSSCNCRRPAQLTTSSSRSGSSAGQQLPPLPPPPPPLRQRRPRLLPRVAANAGGDPGGGGGSGGGSPTTEPQPQQQQQQQQPQPQPQPLPTSPTGAVVYGGRLPSRRRFVGGTATAAALALGSNFLGVTSALLGLSPDLAGTLRLDVLVPVRGYKRCVGDGFDFRYPATWLGDVTLAQRAAVREEAARGGLDLPPLRSPPSTRQASGAGAGARAAARRDVVEPVAAFGPAGSTGEENVSVVVAPLMPGFSLERLGTAEATARQFLDTIAAPPGSGRAAELLQAGQRVDAQTGVLYYAFEFTITREGAFDRHNLAVLAARDDLLYTFTAQCPSAKWARDGGALRESAASFRLLPQAGGEFPGRL